MSVQLEQIGHIAPIDAVTHEVLPVDEDITIAPSTESTEVTEEAQADVAVTESVVQEGGSSSEVAVRKPHKHKKSKNMIKKRKVGDEIRKHKFKPGTRALMEIRRQQRDVSNIIPKSSFTRLVRGICDEVSPGYRWTRNALAAIQADTEAYLIENLNAANVVALHSGRRGINAEDMKVVRLVKDTVH